MDSRDVERTEIEMQRIVRQHVIGSKKMLQSGVPAWDCIAVAVQKVQSPCGQHKENNSEGVSCGQRIESHVPVSLRTCLELCGSL